MQLQESVRVLGQLLGEVVGGRFVDALELIEERDLFLLLFWVLDDLLPLALDVRRGDLSLRALREECAGRHRKRGRDRAEQTGGEHEAGTAGGARYARDDAEHRRQ